MESSPCHWDHCRQFPLYRPVTSKGDGNHPGQRADCYALNWRRVCQMRDTQKKMLEWIETIVTGYNGTGAELEL